MITKTNEYFLFGGASDTNIADTTYKLIPVDGGENPSFKWKKITLPEEDTLKPEGRRGHTVTAWKEDGGIEKMVLFGGCDSENKCFNDVWIFKTEEEKWEKFEVTGATMPAARSKHDAFIRDDKLYIYGGLKDNDNSKALGDMYVLNLKDTEARRKVIPESQYGNAKRGAIFNGGSMVYLKQKDMNIFIQAQDAAVQALRLHGYAQMIAKMGQVTDDGNAGSAQFEGKYCNTKKQVVAPSSSETCPQGCNSHGECKDGKCHCKVGYAGDDCSIKTCKDNCNSHGTCKNGKCM